MEQTEEVQAMTARDSLGREIRLGDTITYPGRYSSSMWMNVGVVRGISHVEASRWKQAYSELSVERLEIKDEYSRDRAAHAFLARRLVGVSALDRVVLLGMSEAELLGVLERRISDEQAWFDRMHQERLEREAAQARQDV